MEGDKFELVRAAEADPTVARSSVTASVAAEPRIDQWEPQYEKLFMDVLEELIAARYNAPVAIGANQNRWYWRLLRRISGFRLLAAPAPPLARLTILGRRLADASSVPGFAREAYLAALQLKGGGRNDEIAIVLDDLEYAGSQTSGIRALMGGLLKSLIGVCVVVALWAIVTSIYLRAYNTQNMTTELGNLFIFIASTPLVISAAFGWAGGFVSIMMRLDDFDGPRRRSQQFLSLTGMMLPIVGAIFACVICAIIKSGLIPLELNGGAVAGPRTTPYVYIVFGFLSGFSERFTRGVLEKVGTGGFAQNRTADVGVRRQSGTSRR